MSIESLFDKTPHELETQMSRRNGRRTSRSDIVAGFYEGMTPDEIAEAAGTTVKVVTEQLGRAGVFHIAESERRWLQFLSGPMCKSRIVDIAEIMDWSAGRTCRALREIESAA
jgi:hypothetical protein